MKKKIIAILLSLGLSASVLSGCGEAVKDAISSKTDEASSNLDDIKEEDDTTDLLMGKEPGTLDTHGKVSEEITLDEAEIREETADDDTNESVSENSERVSESGQLPTFKIARKKYSKRYEGNAKFDESNEDSKDYSKGVLYEGVYESLLMDEECKEDYPLLYEAINEAAATRMSNSDKWADETASQAESDYEEAAKNGYSFYGPYNDYEEVSVKRSDNVVLSVYDNNSNYTGGAHGMYGVSCDNYDVNSGKKLDISDVIDSTKEELDEIIKKKVLEAADEDIDFANIDEELANYQFNASNDAGSEGSASPYTWYFSYDGMHVVFNPYEIASYASGMQDIVIGYDEYQGMIKEKYIPAKDTPYCVKEDIAFLDSRYVSDYKDMHFEYTAYEDESTEDYMVSEDFCLVKDGKKAAVDSGFWVLNENSFDIYRVGTEDGKEYVYLFVPGDNDYTDLYVFDITGDDVKLAGKDFYHDFEDNLDNWYVADPILTDPHNMRLGSVGDAFGSYTYYGTYEVGADGLPKSTSDEYYLVWKSEEAYSKADIKADYIDEAGNVLEEGATIPKGEHFVPFRTDQKSYMDFKLDNGKMIRVKYTSFEYPRSIAEGEIDELFDGLVYAG